jgi:hypothetical protein
MTNCDIIWERLPIYRTAALLDDTRVFLIIPTKVQQRTLCSQSTVNENLSLVVLACVTSSPLLS